MMDDHPQSFTRGIHIGRALEAAEAALAVEHYDRARQLLDAACGLTDELIGGEFAKAQRAIRAVQTKFDAALAARVALPVLQ